MENLKIIYIDDYPETSLSKYLDKYKNSSCNVESLDIKFNPDAGYESLINNPDVKSANIIFIDSKLFENRTAIAGKFTGEEFKIILKKYFPFIEVIVKSPQIMKQFLNMILNAERRQWNIMMKSFLQYWTNVLEIFLKLEKLPQNCKRILAGKKLWSKK